MVIRDERDEDANNIRHVIKAAFDCEDEADLVEALRLDGSSKISLVMEDEGQIIGHVMLSKMKEPTHSLGLGPISVEPGFQGKGIGSRLIRESINRSKKDGWKAIIVLGETDYYARFGFQANLIKDFSSPYAGPNLMALELQKDILKERDSNIISYAPAFDAL